MFNDEEKFSSRSQWLRGLMRGSAAARLLGLNVIYTFLRLFSSLKAHNGDVCFI